jgi:hypothetical protein
MRDPLRQTDEEELKQQKERCAKVNQRVEKQNQDKRKLLKMVRRIKQLPYNQK